MLILTRRPGETIVIDGKIKIEILGIKGNQARIGIDAPRHMSVHRGEIQAKVDAGEMI